MEKLLFFAKIMGHPQRWTIQAGLDSVFRSALKDNNLVDRLKTELNITSPLIFEYLMGIKYEDLIRRQCNDWLNIPGLRIICLGDIEYPDEFMILEYPPLMLFCMGNLESLGQNKISVVGSRDLKINSQKWMETELLKFLILQKPILVSGGAIGVDQKAHELSLASGGRTIVVLPSGTENLYPQSLAALREKVLHFQGAMISEYPPKTPMRKHHFVQRNRLIAALGIFTLVVQAGKKSGTLITAHRALEMGRPLAVLPSHPLDQSYSGSLDLLRCGAGLVVDAEDLGIFYEIEMRTEKHKTSIFREPRQMW